MWIAYSGDRGEQIFFEKCRLYKNRNFQANLLFPYADNGLPKLISADWVPVPWHVGTQASPALLTLILKVGEYFLYHHEYLATCNFPIRPCHFKTLPPPLKNRVVFRQGGADLETNCLRGGQGRIFLKSQMPVRVF